MTERNKIDKNFGKKKKDVNKLSEALKSNIKRRKEIQKKKASVDK